MLALVVLPEVAALTLSLAGALASVGHQGRSATDITVDSDKPLNYAVPWGVGVNPGNGNLDPTVENANWCDQSYPNQSPINIQNQDMVAVYERTPLPVTLHTVADTTMVLTSNGVELELEGDWLTLTQNGNTYEASQLHFHAPSEHVFNGIHCAGEMHIVANNVDTSIASGDPNAHAVIGFCLELGLKGATNDFFDHIASVTKAQALAEFPDTPAGGGSRLQEMIVPGYTSTPLLGLDLTSFKAQLEDDFAYYLGSYTTPACTSNINWFMMAKPVPVAVEIMELMESRFSAPANHRPIQALTSRKINHHHICDCASPKVAAAGFRDLLFASSTTPSPDTCTPTGCAALCAK